MPCLIILIIFCEHHKLRSSSLRTFLQPYFFRPLWSKYSLQHPLLNNPQFMFI
jgi:hypothetical protein